jgi:arylsulfatase A-like enzyme
MIWRYDGVFPENESREHLIGLNDVFATLYKIVGVDIPYGTAYDSSVSFAPYICSLEGKD